MDSHQFTPVPVASVMQTADKKLTFIPIVFILLRIWGTAQFFYIFGLSHKIHYVCVPHHYWIADNIFGYAQVY